jgi:alkylhydroperoxidase family enzyme
MPGAPRPVGAADAIRARVPTVLDVYATTRETVLEGGIVDAELKRLCARFLAEDEDAEASNERERAALDWAQAIGWNSDLADDDLWRRLHEHFSEPELVELGYAIAFMLGQQHWLRTLGVDPLA